MPLSGFSTEKIAELQQQLIEATPADGTSIGNMRLRDDILRWDNDLYLAVRALLLDKGEIVSGRGKGGSVRRPATVLPSEVVDEGIIDANAPEHVIVPELYPDEASLYDPLTKVIRERWVQDQSFDQFVVENTDRGGRRRDGIWTRPDITVAAMTSYMFVPGKHFDVISFEIKHHRGFNVTALYEALAHRRAATQSYVVVYIPDDLLDAFESPILSEITDEASRHGIGLIVVGDPTNFDNWDIREKPVRVNPDPASLNEFIRNQLAERTREQIVRWFR